MRITLRLIVSLIFVVASVAFFSAYFQVKQEKERQRDELERRSNLLAQTLQEAVEPLLQRGPSGHLQRLVEKFGNRERLAGIAIYDTKQSPLAITISLAPLLPTPPRVVTESFDKNVDAAEFDSISGKEMHLYALPLRRNEKILGTLVIFHDATYIQSQLSRIRRHAFLRILIQTILISIVTLLIVRWSVVGPIAQMAEWIKQIRSGEIQKSFTLPEGDLFASITREVSTLTRHLSEAKTAAEEEARLRQAAESLWTAEHLKEHVRAKFQGKPLFIISNREPYMHLRRSRKMEVIIPAGGLITALDPVLRACGGTWIAHGSGNGDWDAVDSQNRLRVPPEDPLYTLKRVALSKEEENGYYYGFSNEGLWPLCHIAHTRPTFRAEDWEHYQKANQKFAQAAFEEMEDVEEPCILVQDYHFALLPRFLKEKRPDAKIALFWHIPWPNPEAFGICPWQRELLFGMLGADLIGFQTQFHCNNFLDTVDRTLESRIDWERFAVEKEGHITLVKPFPISVSFPYAFQDVSMEESPKLDRATLLKELGIKAKYLGVGVERMDYTKG
ncbi:MAG: trehalose-6-phosphate synthase, partial [Elusimicrobia bacterium]|nr:trehalose-6-phosphate synthase [Elusimicrobiota bacterium]